jgi:NitT/TauT family transport system substrate-binding protein
MWRPPRPLRSPLAAVLLCLALVATACGGDSGSSGSPSGGDAAGDLTTVRVGVIPITAIAPFEVGLQHGFFREAGLDVKASNMAQGAAILPAVLSGDLDIGFANVVSTLTAGAKGLPVRIIAEGPQDGTNEHNAYVKLLVGSSSPVRRPRDLVGKTVAVNSLKDVGVFSTQATVSKDGGDPHKVHFLEIPFSEMPAALDAGRVDAIWETEPFLTQVQDRTRAIAAPEVTLMPRYTVAVYFSTEQFISEHRDAVVRFVRAMEKSVDYTLAHPDAAAKVISTYTKISPGLAGKLTPPHFQRELDVGSLELTARLMKTYGVTSETVDVDSLVPDFVPTTRRTAPTSAAATAAGPSAPARPSAPAGSST